ncbi:MAG: class I SAM-dependent methyltransferase [Microthrixaceae bacterium]
MNSPSTNPQSPPAKTPGPRTLDDIPGWFILTDRWIFERILTWQNANQEPGDLVELGVYKGKSAVHIGRFVQPGESFTVLDLFEDVHDESDLHQADRNAYRTLSEDEFRANYLAFHDELPAVVRGLSSEIEDHVEAGSCRLVHIDASHMYEHVLADAQAARRLLRPDGVVVFDDYRTEHTPGTACAVWETIINSDLHPICASPMKMYATWGDPGPLQAEIIEQLAATNDYRADPHEVVRGERLIRVVGGKAKHGGGGAKASTKSGPASTPGSSGGASQAKALIRRVANKVQRLAAE